MEFKIGNLYRLKANSWAFAKIVQTPVGKNNAAPSGGLPAVKLNNLSYSSKNGMYVAVGGNGETQTSQDGVTWTQSTSKNYKRGTIFLCLEEKENWLCFLSPGGTKVWEWGESCQDIFDEIEE